MDKVWSSYEDKMKVRRRFYFKGAAHKRFMRTHARAPLPAQSQF